MREIKFRALTKDGFTVVAPLCVWGIETAYPIMQYTGLKDKNGKEIYEGDIVYAHLNDGTYKVEWGGYMIVGEFEDECCYGPYLNDGSGSMESAAPGDLLEVIGNVYENPELVKK